MPILVFYTGANVDKRSYEHIKDDVGWEGEPPPGALLHLSGFDERDRAYEVTLWETEEAYEIYRDERMMPAVRRAGVDLPDAAVVPLYNAAISDVADRFVTLVPSARTIA